MRYLKNNNFLQHVFIILSLLLSFLIIFFVYKRNSTENIKDVVELWTIYDLNVDAIKKNLEEIMSSSNSSLCGNLKDIELKEQTYLFALNNLACSINLYYYNLIEFNESYNNYLLEYRNKNKVTANEVNDLKSKLKNDNGFPEGIKKILVLDYYEDDNELIDDMFKKINIFLNDFNTNYYEQKNLNYKELFVHKMSELSYIANLSTWLKNEYYLHKN